MKQLLLWSALLTANLMFSQQSSCDCTASLSKLIDKVEKNYPGFSEKSGEQSGYQDIRGILAQQSNNADEISCQKLMKKYTDFFKDPHLWVGKNGAPFSFKGSAEAERTEINIQEFEKYLKTSKDQLEGIWLTDGYKIGIKKNRPNEYTGFIMEAASSSWKMGDLKFRLLPDNRFEYVLMDKTKNLGNFKLYDENILFFEGIEVALSKQISNPDLIAKQKSKLKELEGFYFKKLSAKTTYLKLPSFDHPYLKQIDQLIENNRSLLENSENLIIDLRGNPGGSTDGYQKLLPYISGKAIYHTGAEFYASESFLNSLENYKKKLGKDDSSETVDNQIKKVKENMGRYFNHDEKGGLNRVQNIEVALKSPKKIVILANKRTGSSAEYLLYIAKQSTKVKIMGIPSYGALDYGNAIMTDFGCADYQLLLPTYKAMRLPDYPIDNIGIQPDVYLDQSVKDWVKFAEDYMEN